VIRKGIGLYLFPFRLHPSLFYYVKGVFFHDYNEHLYRTEQHINLNRSGLDGSIMIDVGAAVGGVASYFADRYPELKIYCIEPNHRLLPALDEISRHRSNIFIKDIALSNSGGEFTLHVTSNQRSSSLNELNDEEVRKLSHEHRALLEETESFKVKTSTLDEEFKDAPRILLIKLDTQGTELEILKGGLETLKRTKFVLTEMNNHRLYKNTCQYYEVDDFLRAHGFRLVDVIVTYHTGEEVQEYDALYENTNPSA
jgi:FkbM family methyltransferase